MKRGEPVLPEPSSGPGTQQVLKNTYSVNEGMNARQANKTPVTEKHAGVGEKEV